MTKSTVNSIFQHYFKITLFPIEVLKKVFYCSHFVRMICQTPLSSTIPYFKTIQDF